MTQEHPITPPLELMQQWAAKYWGRPNRFLTDGEKYFATQAARWGADIELEACCEWAAEQDRGFDDELRTARRPKPPSRKQRALDALVQFEEQHLSAELAAEIRNALEALPDD